MNAREPIASQMSAQILQGTVAFVGHNWRSRRHITGALGTPSGLATRCPWILFIAVTVFAAGLGNRDMPDFIVVDYDVEDKGSVTIPIVTPMTITKDSHFRPKSCMSLNPNMPLDPVVVPNTETILVPTGNAIVITLYNIYPLVIDVPGTSVKTAMIDVYDVLAADSGSGIGSLPPGMVLEQSSFFGTVSNATYTAQITPITDLADLPTSSANDSAITWDLSSLSGTTGNFYLAKVTLPFEDVASVPEPSAAGLLLVGTLGVFVYTHKRCRKAVWNCRAKNG